MKRHVKYSIKRRKDGSYDILMKDTQTKKLTIHSNHDTYEDAHDEWVDIHHKPSQTETLSFIRDLKDSIIKL